MVEAKVCALLPGRQSCESFETRHDMVFVCGSYEPGPLGLAGWPGRLKTSCCATWPDVWQVTRCRSTDRTAARRSFAAPGRGIPPGIPTWPVERCQKRCDSWSRWLAGVAQGEPAVVFARSDRGRGPPAGWGGGRQNRLGWGTCICGKPREDRWQANEWLT